MINTLHDSSPCVVELHDLRSAPIKYRLTVLDTSSPSNLLESF